MKKDQIRVGGHYEARVSGRYVTVRVDAIREVEAHPRYGSCRNGVRYDVTNLTTGRKTTFRSAAKFRREVKQGGAVLGAAVDAIREEMVAQVRAEEAGANRQRYNEETEQWEDEEGEQRSDPMTSTAVAPVATPASVAAPPAVLPAPATAPASKLASRIAAAAQATPQAANLTDEQEDILATARRIEAEGGQRVLVIGAGAGTGKTFTLKQLEQVLRGNGQYTAFNSSLVAESKGKFRRAACNTTHSLAFRSVGRKFAHRLNGARVQSWEIARRLGIEDYHVTLPDSMQPRDEEGNLTTSDGKPAQRRIPAKFLAGKVIVAIRRFCQSDRPALSAHDFGTFDGIDESGSRTNSDRVCEYLLPFAERAWADLTDPLGTTMPFSHDVYVKLWQLGTGPDRPVIAADYILLDEAQDTAPVMLDILRQQTHALLILVGDDNQQIYEWRGAVNAMASFRGAPRRLLSQSFRFGQAVADVANSVLATLEEPTDLVMRGMPTIPTRVCAVAAPRCYLYRTNAGAIGRLMAERAAGRRPHLIGGTVEVVKFCAAAADLIAGRRTNHPELGCFTTWTEVQDYSKTDEGADLRLMVKLIDDFGAEAIREALADMPPEERADVVISTAHKSKGREWSSVRLGQDFPTANKMSDSDRRLLYVAVTRAQEELDITECPTFVGGYDRAAGQGGPDASGAAEWVPGIPITYTAAMPSEADLAAYRAAKDAPKPAPAAPAADTTPAPKPAPAAPQAPANAGIPNTWARGKMNDWVVRGAPGQRGTVTVTRKDGSTSRVQIGRVIWQNSEVALYEVI